MKLLVTPKSSNTGVFEKYFLSRESKIAICGEMISFPKKRWTLLEYSTWFTQEKKKNKWCLKFDFKQVTCFEEKN